MRRHLVAIIAVALTAITLSGCANLSGLGMRLSLDQEQAQIEPNPRIAQPAPRETPTPYRSPKKHDDTYKLGDTIHTKQGINITVMPPEEITISRGAGYDEYSGIPVYKITITIENQSGKAFDPQHTLVYAASQGKELERIYSIDNELGGSPSTKILDGKSISWGVGFQIPDPNDLTVEIRHSKLGYAIFTNE